MGYFIAGLFVSIPLAVIANLFTPLVQRRLEERSTVRAELERQRGAQFEREVNRLAAQPNALVATLLASLIRIAYFGALLGALAGVLALLASGLITAGTSDVAYGGLLALSQLAALIATLITLNIARRSYSLYVSVRRKLNDASSGHN